MDKLSMVRLLACVATGWFYAKATSELKPVVAVVAIWAWAVFCALQGVK